MSKRMLFLIIPAILLLAVVAFPASMVPRAHAAITGEVCLNDPTTGIGSATPCPATPAPFSGPSGQQIRVGIFISGSDTLNGFDVSLIADHTVLVPIGVDLTGTVLPGTPTVILECLQDVKISGTVCPATDTVDTLTFVVSGGLGLLTTPPTTGLLFTAIYNIVGTTAAGGIPVGYQTGCGSATSVMGGVCVTISAGATGTDAETAQAGTFDNSIPSAFVAITASPTSFGPEFPGVTNTATVTATAMNGYPGFATDAVTFTTATTTGLTATLTGLNPCATMMTSCSVSLALSATAAGNYVATVTGTYATTDSLGNPDTLSGVVTLNVGVNDFGFTVSPATISFASGSTGSATITLSSLNNFAGSITLSTGISTPATPPLTITYNPTTVTLTAGATMTSTATFSASPTLATTYHAQIKATSGTRVKTSAIETISVTPPVADFSLAANPTTVSALAGATGTSTLTVAPSAGFTGTVNLVSSVLPATGLTCSFSSASITGGSGTSTLSCSGSAGSYTVTVTGTSGTLSHTATVSFTVQDFTISATSPVAVSAGMSATSAITITAQNGFAGVVSLTDTIPAGLTCGAITPNSVTGSGTATVSCSATIAGPYDLTVTGTSTTLTHSATATFTFNAAPDFTTAASSPTPVNVGQSATSTITITAMNGFTGVVTISDTVPTGLTCGAPSGTVTGSGTATISCSATVAGTYSLPVTGTSGSLVHSATATFIFVDFSIAASSPASVSAGVSATSTITITALNGFAGTVALTDTVPSGLVCGSITPGSVAGSGTATISCSAALAGSYVLTVTGTSTSLTHSATATFTVTVPADFTIGASLPSSVNVGQSSTSTITITALNGFAGTVTLTDTTPAGLTCGAITPGSVTGSGTATVSCSATVAGMYTLSITGTSGSLVHTAMASFNFADFTIAATSPTATVGTPASSTITIVALNGGGTITFTDTVPAGLTCNQISPSSLPGSGTAILTCSSTTAATFSVTVTGTSGSLTHSAMATFTFTAAPDFSISATSPATVNTGSSATSTITVTALNGFTGVVTLTDTVPSGLTCGAMTPGSVTASGTATVSCAATLANNYVLTITGTSGSLTHSATATFAVVGFALAATSPSGTVGASIISTITVTGQNGFAGTVTLTDTVPTGLTCGTITPSSVTGSGTATLSCTSTTANSFAVTVTGTSGSLTHTATATFTFSQAPDFTIAATSPAALNAGSSATSTITVTALNGFVGTVSLTDTAPAGLTCGTITPNTVTGSGTATVSCTSTTASAFALTVTGTSGSITHSATANFNFVDFTISATSPSTVTVGSSATSTITIAAVNGFAGTVGLTDTVPAGLTCGAITPTSLVGAGTATLACTSTTASTFTVTITGTAGSLSHSASATFTFANAADFSISATSPSAVNTGVSATSTITISALNGFSGVVALTDTVPAGLTCGAITPNSVTGSGTATLSCTSASPGSLSVTVTGTSGSLVHSATSTFMFTAAADFTISASSPSVVTVGQSVNSTITITAVNGFSGVATLTDTVPSGLVCGAITPSSVTSSGTATVTCSSTVPATYKLTVTGTSGSLTHSTTATFTFNPAQDFAITASPTIVSIVSGTSGNSTVTVSALNGFTGTVSLNATVPPSTGLTCTLSRTTISGGSGTSVLSCTGTTGAYTVTIMGTSGAHSHSTTVAFNVSPSTGVPVLLTFQGFDLDDFENGLGQLQVSVNGHLVVDIPSGLNHLNGTGDFAPYTNKWIRFGPFDITGFIVQGQNTILFRDPQTSDHFGLIKNVTIVQGNTILLHVERARGVSMESSVTYTFSIPPLVITGFTASPSTATVDQQVTFTATYTGGTAPFKCIFSFGDFEFASIAGVNGTCSVTHDYDFNGTFHALVTVKGASTSDLRTSKLTITVSGNDSDDTDLSSIVALATVESS